MQDRAADTIRRIVHAAGEIFDEDGYAGATTPAIQQRAKVSRGGFYHHFPSKEALGHAVLEHQNAFFEQMSEAVAPGPGRPLQGLWLQFLVDTSYAYCHGLRTDPVLRAGVRLSMEPGPYQRPGSYTPQLAAVTAVLESARQAAELQPAIQPEPTAQTVVGFFTGVQTLSQIITGRRDLDEQVRTMWSLCLPGIARPDVLTHLLLAPPSADADRPR